MKFAINEKEEFLYTFTMNAVIDTTVNNGDSDSEDIFSDEIHNGKMSLMEDTVKYLNDVLIKKNIGITGVSMDDWDMDSDSVAIYCSLSSYVEYSIAKVKEIIEEEIPKMCWSTALDGLEAEYLDRNAHYSSYSDSPEYVEVESSITLDICVEDVTDVEIYNE